MADRLEKLKALEAKLYVAMETAGNKEIAAIAKQYRETVKEIEEIDGEKHADNDIANILRDRKSAGRAGSVRKGRAGV